MLLYKELLINNYRVFFVVFLIIILYQFFYIASSIALGQQAPQVFCAVRGMYPCQKSLLMFQGWCVFLDSILSVCRYLCLRCSVRQFHTMLTGSCPAQAHAYFKQLWQRPGAQGPCTPNYHQLVQLCSRRSPVCLPGAQNDSHALPLITVMFLSSNSITLRVTKGPSPLLTMTITLLLPQ